MLQSKPDRRKICQIVTVGRKYYFPPDSQASSDFIHYNMAGKKKVSQFIKGDVGVDMTYVPKKVSESIRFWKKQENMLM